VAKATTHKSSYFFRSLLSQFAFEFCSVGKVQTDRAAELCGIIGILVGRCFIGSGKSLEAIRSLPI
jgi:hypothetical protein